MIFNILKAVHIFAIIAWMVGLLYLPRLFVYHSNPNINKETSATFKLMERKLYKIIMLPSFILTWISGLSMTHYIGFDTWLIIKVLFVIILSFYHFFCLKCINDFAKDRNKLSPKFFRITNEIPSVILILIIILVIFQPF